MFSVFYGKILPFQSTPSVWRETYDQAFLSSTVAISIHSLRVEGDALVRCKRTRMCLPFQSTPSVWRETLKPPEYTDTRSISIHSLRVEGDCIPPPQIHPATISTHSLRVEGDVVRSYVAKLQTAISIHSLRVEGDAAAKIFEGIKEFQSTPSVWRETPWSCCARWHA